MKVHIPTPTDLVSDLSPADEATIAEITTLLVAEIEQQIKVQGKTEATVFISYRLSNTVLDTITTDFGAAGWNVEPKQNTFTTTIVLTKAGV